MWRLLALTVFCSLAGPLQGQGGKSAPAILGALSPPAILKYFTNFICQNNRLQSHLLAIQFPDIQHKEKPPEQWITDLHIVKASVPAVTVDLQGKTADAVICVKVRLHLSAKFFFGKLFERFDFIVDTDIRSRVKPADFFMGIFRLKYELCKSEFKIAKIICPVNLLVNQVRPILVEVLKAKLPKPLCHAVELVIRLGSIDFQYTSNVLLSIGTIATVHYRISALPLITSSAVAMEFKVSIRTGGRIIVLPSNPEPVSVPVVRGNSVCLGITQAALHVFLSILVRVQPREFICTPEVFSGAVELTDAIAELLINQKCPKCSTKSPLKITLTVVSVPVITLEPKRTIIAISVELGIYAKGPSGTISGLFVVRANLKLSTQISVHDCKLILTTQLTSLELILVSSEVGPIDVSGLVKVMKALLVETLMPQINDGLTTGIPLPSLLHLKMAYPMIEISHGILVLCV